MSETTDQIVYIVDDDPGMLDSTAWLLESVGLKTACFSNGRDFLAAYSAEQGGCVLLDVRMPGLGGLNVQEEMGERGIDLPVILVSGHADVPMVVRAFKGGASDFIEKPFNEQMLLDSVQQALQDDLQQRCRAACRNTVRARIAALTPREHDVLGPLADGLTNREIAAHLDVSIKTVELYRSRVMKKMQADNLQQLVGMAIVAGLIDPCAAIQLERPAQAM